ncbi:MAG: M15 family metallopeptidase [Dehalococcoidia bacterium]
MLTLVDKQHALPLAYVPLDLVPIPEEYVSSLDRQQLRQAAKEALVRMLNVALQEGLTIKVNSAYRSAQYQLAVFRTEVAAVGCTQALRESAVPGHSEHQLGLAADLTTASVGWGLEDAFGQTVEGRWLAEHAAGYGFVLSYPEGKETVTGYQFEPWHYRYVTEPLAAAIVRSRKTPAEYLGSLGSVSSTPLSSSTPEAVAATACA